MASTHPASSKARSPRRRDREVLDAAVEVFARRGYADASVQDVADAVGILKGSLYHYIDSKEDLLFRVLLEVHDEVEAILAEILALDDVTPLDRLGRYVTRQVLYNLSNIERISIYYHDVDHLSAAHRKEIYARRHVHERFVADLVREAQGSGEADGALDPRMAANCVFGTIIWVYRGYRPGGRLGREELAAMCSRYVVAGIAG